MSATCSSPPSSSAIDMKSSYNSNKDDGADPQQMQQKIKKCALKSKNIKAKTFSKISQKCAKNLRKSHTTTIKATQKQNSTPKTIINNNNNNNNQSSKCGRRKPLQQKQTDNKKAQKQQHLLAPPSLKQTNKSKAIKKVEPPPQQLLHLTTKENFLLTLDLLAVVRRNASDKLKLIQMVHDNPILWDSRLPNFKGAEEEKNSAWEQIGREFNSPGRRVARAFKSLRESYRRELAHVKLMGNGFKPKWSLYDAMDFLRDVIRERKGGSHAAEHSSLGLNLSAFAHHISASSSLHLHSPNSSLNGSGNNNNNIKSEQSAAYAAALNNAALNLSKSTLNMSHHNDYYYGSIKPEMDLSNQSNGATAAATAAIPAAHQQHNGGGSNSHHHHHHNNHHSNHHQQQQQQSHDSRVSSTRNDTSNQNTTFDDMDASSLRSDAAAEDEASAAGSEGVEELEAIDADFPYPLILDSTNSPNSGGALRSNSTGHHSMKRRRKQMSGSGGTDDNDEEDNDDEEEDVGYEGQMLQQHRHLRLQQQQQQQQHQHAGATNGVDMPPPQTVREVLNSKFCGFISAKLNSMEDSEADNLMNKILMLLVQTQGNNFEGK